MKRLKVADQSPIHRSTDCIVSKELGTSSDSELLKPAPSWTNIAMKSTEQSGTSKFLHNLTCSRRFEKGFYFLPRCKCSVCAKSNDGRRATSGRDCSKKIQTQAKACEERTICRNLFPKTKRKTSKRSRTSCERES